MIEVRELKCSEHEHGARYIITAMLNEYEVQSGYWAKLQYRYKYWNIDTDSEGRWADWRDVKTMEAE